MPPVFVMGFPSASLLFESRFDEEAQAYEAEYCVYRLAPGQTQLKRPPAEAVGRIPVSDVEFEEARGLTLKTMGVERFL